MIEMNEINFDRKYDLIVMTEVFEHFAINPVETMRMIGNALKKNGRILLTTPDYNNLYTYRSWIELPRLEDVDETRYRELLNCGHVYQYTRKEIEQILFEADLEIELYEQSDSSNHNICIKKR